LLQREKMYATSMKDAASIRAISWVLKATVDFALSGKTWAESFGSI